MTIFKDFLGETREILLDYDKSEDDINFVTDGNAWMTWPIFVCFMRNLRYRIGCGSNVINKNLKLVGRDFWFERATSDGREWWVYKTMPKKPCVRNDLQFLSKDIYDYGADEIKFGED